MYARVSTSPVRQSWITHGTRPLESKLIWGASMGRREFRCLGILAPRGLLDGFEPGEPWVRLLQVPGERAPAHALAADDMQQRGQGSGRDPGDRLLEPPPPGDPGTRIGREARVVGERLLPRLLALVGRADLPPGRDPEVERRADPLAGEREAVAGAVAGEEHAVLGRGPEPMREPVALVADGVDVQPAGDLLGRLLDVVARLVGADADALLALGRHRPRVALADEAAVDPHIEIDASAVRMHLEAARDRRLGRLDILPRRQDAAPAERVDNERRSQGSAIRRHKNGADSLPPGGIVVCGYVFAPSAVHFRDLETRVALLPQRAAQLAVVEARPAPGQPEARGPVRRVERHARDLLPDRALDAHRLKPGRRRGARGRRALADLVAVDDEHVRAAA